MVEPIQVERDTVDLIYRLERIAHVAAGINDKPVRCITSIRRQQNMILHGRIVPYLEAAGLYQVALLSNHWFKDVTYQFGLPVDGTTVSGCLTDFHLFMREQGCRPAWVWLKGLFGQFPLQEHIDKFTVSYSWFQETFRVLPDDATEETMNWGVTAGDPRPLLGCTGRQTAWPTLVLEFWCFPHFRPHGFDDILWLFSSRWGVYLPPSDKKDPRAFLGKEVNNIISFAKTMAQSKRR
ncbi:hypothetical protein PIB30_022377 [Stylosanthes scabra]|uniref:Uncharacterized protein n=1 Tax=Stylosanthes scabra TaxID=79078 RepID=A0ABU6X7C7_9FABA|nr:hypothetical protein [Stylosanthes scabra]